MINPIATEIEVKEIRKLISIISDVYGHDFSNYAMSSFKRRVQRIMQLKKYDHVDKLIEYIKTNEAFYENILSEITVNVTEMFRDPTFWKEIRDNIIPDILEKKGHLRIWHAGCASGEEVLSMVILLKEMDKLDQATILATDLDKSIIELAEKGFVLGKSMPMHENNYNEFSGDCELHEYFRPLNGKFIFDKLMQHVTFQVHDLVLDDAIGQFDLILCRNVMIYFNQTLQDTVLKKFHGVIPIKGYLALGVKENIGWCQVSNKFKLLNSVEKIYQKINE